MASLGLLLASGLLLALALLVRPRLASGMQDAFEPRRTQLLGTVELGAGRDYRLIFEERLPQMARDPSGRARLDVYLEPVLEAGADLGSDPREARERSLRAGSAEIEVRCEYTGMRAARCEVDADEVVDFEVASSGRYRVRVRNSGGRTARFLKMSLVWIPIDWWLALIPLGLAAGGFGWVFLSVWRRSGAQGEAA